MREGGETKVTFSKNNPKQNLGWLAFKNSIAPLRTIYRSWYDGGVDHRQDRVHLGAYDAYLQEISNNKGIFTKADVSQQDERKKDEKNKGTKEKLSPKYTCVFVVFTHQHDRNPW